MPSKQFASSSRNPAPSDEYVNGPAELEGRDYEPHRGPSAAMPLKQQFASSSRIPAPSNEYVNAAAEMEGRDYEAHRGPSAPNMPSKQFASSSGNPAPSNAFNNTAHREPSAGNMPSKQQFASSSRNPAPLDAYINGPAGLAGFGHESRLGSEQPEERFPRTGQMSAASGFERLEERFPRTGQMSAASGFERQEERFPRTGQMSAASGFERQEESFLRTGQMAAARLSSGNPSKAWAFGRAQKRSNIVCETVHSWANDAGNARRFDLERNSKPLIFGGTFPIDMPMGQSNYLRMIASKNANESSPEAVKTYEIDAPCLELLEQSDYDDDNDSDEKETRKDR